MHQLNGISVITCCHNSRHRLSRTLEHIAEQELSNNYKYELIIVDNCSTDNIQNFAEKKWKSLGSPFPLKTVNENRPGLTFARMSGINNSAYDLIVFCDDDNWLEKKYLCTALDIFNNNPEIAIAGGRSFPVFEETPPVWFDKFFQSYAIGKQAKNTSDITDSREYIWGSGMIVRKKVYYELIRRGFKPLLSDRKGTILSSGGDSELCFAVRLLGYRLYYDERLKFKHYITKNRLNWNYIRKLWRSFGRAMTYLKIYKYMLRCKKNKIKSGHIYSIWLKLFTQMLTDFWPYKKGIIYYFLHNKGNINILFVEHAVGEVIELIRIIPSFSQRIKYLHKTFI